MALNDVCSECGRSHSGIGIFAHAFQQSELKQGRPDPGNRCGLCAAEWLKQCTPKEQAVSFANVLSSCDVAVDIYGYRRES